MKKQQQVKATGLIAYKALVDHALENALAAPLSVDLSDDALRVWVSAANAPGWVDSIYVDREYTTDTVTVGREIVYVEGRLPLLGVKVQLRFSRRAAPALLRAVTA